MHKLHLHKCLVISLTVRGLRETVKRRSIFTYLKDQEANFYFYKKRFLKQVTKPFGEMNGAVKFTFLTELLIAKVFVSWLIER